MYEKTIGNEHLVCNITIPSVPTKVVDLLSAEDMERYNNILRGNTVNLIPEDSPFYRRPYSRIPVDGYIFSFDNYWFSGTSQNGSFELIPVEERCTFPVAFWLDKSYIYSSVNINGTLRIYFS
jgi:hypothetical protein